MTHLPLQDAEEWARLADMSTELGDLEQAAACFRKAIDAEPDNMRYHLSRCSLLEQVNKKSIYGRRVTSNRVYDQINFGLDTAKHLHNKVDNIKDTR